MSWIERFKRRAKATTFPEGPLPDSTVADLLNTKKFVFLIVDDLGRIHQIRDKGNGTSFNISNADVRRVANPRSETLKLLDRFHVEDDIEVPEDNLDGQGT